MSAARQPSPDDPIAPWERRHRLARALEHASWQIKDMQLYLGVSDTTMTNYMQGHTKRISDGTLRSWAAATGTRWEWLRDGTGHWLRDGSESEPAATIGLPERASPCMSDRPSLLASIHALPIAS